MATKLWDAHARINTLFTTTLTDDEVTVYDGPVPHGTSLKNWVLVGSDGGETGVGEGSDDGLTVTQELSDEGPGTWLLELGEITCAVWTWNGGTEFGPLRATAQSILSQLEAAIATDRQLTGLLVKPGFAHVAGIRYHQAQIEKGAQIRAAFTVSYRTLLIP